MSRFHINPQTGDPGRCSAKKQCPFGGGESDHYNSKKEARHAYEKHMETGTLPSIVTNATNLRRLAKGAETMADMRIILDHGDWETKQMLAKNKNTPAIVLQEIWDTDVNSHPSMKFTIGANPNCPVSLMDKDMIAELRYGDPIAKSYRIEKVMSSNELTDKQVEAAIELKMAATAGPAILKNHNLKLSQETLRKLAYANTRNLRIALDHPDLNIPQLLADKSFSAERIQDLQEIAPDEKLRYFMYHHVNCPPKLKEYFETHRPQEFPS